MENKQEKFVSQIMDEKRLGGNEFFVIWNDGSRARLRLFISEDGRVGYFKPRCCRNGYALNLDQVAAIEPVRGRVSTDEKFRKNAKRLAAILTDSGLWGNILEELKLCRFEYGKFREHNADFAEFIAKWKVKKMNFQSDTAKHIKQIRWSIENSRNYYIPRTSFRSYDISFELKCGADGSKRAWYSEEYRGCGNGHYYLAINSTHAIYYERG